MQVVKRNGKREAVNLNKITERIKKLSNELNVDYILVATKTVQGLYDGVTTRELDNLAAEICATMSTIHPDYDVLASRIEVSNLHKETEDSFVGKMALLSKEGSVSQEFADFCATHKKLLDGAIDYKRDYSFDYFGIKTLKKSYLLKIHGKIIERPQDMLMRVAAFINKNTPDEIAETYYWLSNKFYTHATPTLFNAGTVRPQLSSCFLLDIDGDSIDGIYKTLSDCGKISQSAGGIGLAIHKIRASGSPIKGTGGASNGIVPMLRVFDATARYVDQGGGKRKGSIAIYLEPWHSDIFEFLDLKKNTGKEELRARDLFYGLWIPDLFMRRVKEDGKWTLFSPTHVTSGSLPLQESHSDDFESKYIALENSGVGKTIRARDLWDKIITSQIETGTPYMLYKDAANRKSNQQNLGTIKSSNLCVSPDTLVLTEFGHVPIKALTELKVKPKIWNGEEWSEALVAKTGIDQKLLKVRLSNGAELKCTPYHKWYVKNSYSKQEVETRTSELKIGDKLSKFDLPIISDGFSNYHQNHYTHGAFCADGTYNGNGTPRISLYDYKKDLISHLDIKSSSYKEDSSGRINCQLKESLWPKYFVPHISRRSGRLEWLAGLLDFDGCLLNNNGTQSIQIASVNFDFLNQIRLMLQTLGVHSKVCKGQDKRKVFLPDGHGDKKEFDCQKIDRLLIPESGIQKLLELHIPFKRLKPIVRTPNREASQFVKVVSIKAIDNDDTYCVNEPLRHKAVFNGVLTGNCTEIIEFTSPEEIAVCNLASISLKEFFNPFEEDGVDYKLLQRVAGIVCKNLNKVIDVNYYPVKEARTSNERHRPIGIGVQGLADLFALLRIPFDSSEAKKINKRIFEVIYKGAVEASIDLARKDGVYQSYNGSPSANGKLQFDLWGLDESELYTSWKDTKDRLSLYGLRNSLLLAPMPTASTAQILGNNEAFEAFTSNIYTRRTLAGEFIVVNKYLIQDLVDLGLWNETMRQRLIAANGSIQNIGGIPDNIKEIYKTVWEISQRSIIDMAADRGPFICQSQSMNIFMENPTINKLTSMHFYGWERGLKTGSYYIRSQAARDAIKFTVDKGLVQSERPNRELGEHSVSSQNISKIQIEEISKESFEKLCSLDDPENCESCSG